MFVSEPVTPRSPKSARRAPRKKAFATRYVYTEESNTPIKDVVLSIVNGIGMESIEPKLFPRLVLPLNQEIQKLQRAKNYSAIREVDIALEFIQKYFENPKQAEPTDESAKEEIEYSRNIQRIVKIAMNGQRLPEMTKKTRNDVVRELENISYKEQNRIEGKLADEAINRIQSPQRRSIRRFYESQNSTENIDIDAQIETIQSNLQKDLAKLSNEKKNELNRLKVSREAQLNVVNSYVACNPPKDYCKNVPEVGKMRSEEHYLLSQKRYSQAEKLRAKIDALVEQNKVENELRWQNEIERQRSSIESNYSEKYQMKIKYFRHKAQELKATAKKQISELNGTTVKVRGTTRSPAKTLPKLTPKTSKKTSPMRTTRR